SPIQNGTTISTFYSYRPCQFGLFEPNLKLMYRLVLFVLLLAQVGLSPSALPKLQIEGPPELATIRTRLQSLDPRRFADITQLLGASDGGPAIQVILATENSNFARGVSRWIAGFAVGASDAVVIFPDRSPSYPDH